MTSFVGISMGSDAQPSERLFYSSHGPVYHGGQKLLPLFGSAQTSATLDSIGAKVLHEYVVEVDRRDVGNVVNSLVPHLIGCQMQCHRGLGFDGVEIISGGIQDAWAFFTPVAAATGLGTTRQRGIPRPSRARNRALGPQSPEDCR